MHTPTADTAPLDPQPVSARAKLAAAWTSFMFLYIYVDYLHLYNPRAVQDILDGVVWRLDITQAFVVGSLVLVGIPIFMVVLSATLPARACRTITLVMVPIYTVVSAFNVMDAEWVGFFALGAVLEIALLALVARIAWTWPRQTTSDAPVEASRPLQTTQPV